MNRGSSALSPWTVQPEIGFNEAPIHESGKSQTQQAKDTNSRGFNEAPIHESGKLNHHSLPR